MIVIYERPNGFSTTFIGAQDHLTKLVRQSFHLYLIIKKEEGISLHTTEAEENLNEALFIALEWVKEESNNSVLPKFCDKEIIKKMYKKALFEAAIALHTCADKFSYVYHSFEHFRRTKFLEILEILNMTEKHFSEAYSIYENTEE